MWFQMPYPDCRLYQDNDNEDIPSIIEDTVKNIIEEIKSTDTAPSNPAYNTGKLNLKVLRKEHKGTGFVRTRSRI